MLGVELTVTMLIAVLDPTQPKALVPVIEQEVFVNGLTTFDPDEYVYVFAPLGEIVKELPEQIEPLFTEIIGIPLTETVLTAEAVLVQPDALVPVTVQLVIFVGLTTFDPDEQV